MILCTYDGRNFVFGDVIGETPFNQPAFLMVGGVKDTLERERGDDIGHRPPIPHQCEDHFFLLT